MTEPIRCWWAGTDPLMVAYHDEEWGVPLHDEARLFELLTLEGAQAGLSWSTILRRREGYREAFSGFDIPRVASFTDNDVERLMNDPGIIRNRQKVLSAIENAKRVLELGSLDQFVWSFVPNAEPIVRGGGSLPAETNESREMSKALKKRGFTFVGPTICYAFMQSAGLANDHDPTCFRFPGNA